MVQEVLIYLGIIICISVVLSILGKLIRQPSIVAYLLTGIIVGPLFLGIIGTEGGSAEIIRSFAHIGVALLLFIVGLSLDLRVLKEIGKVSTFAGLAEIIITGVIGFFIATGLGFENITALYIGAALAFSSTVVVVKILSDKREIDTLHGKIALGILIVEDFVAALALMAIPLINGNGSILTIVRELGLVILLVLSIFLFATFILKRFMDYLARNPEALFLFGIAWALVLAALFEKLGFSLEIGALIAGMSLASSKYTLDLMSKIRPLRDFFVVLFFVFFGSQLATTVSMQMLGYAIILSLFVIIGKPLIVMTSLRIFGYRKRTNFLTGASIAQISEFSLILILLGYNLGHLPQEIMSLAVLIAIMTIGVSSYSIHYSHVIFNRISHLLNIFEGKKNGDMTKNDESYDILLFGYHRIGYKVLQAVKKMKKSCLIVDYNPKVILDLGKKGLNVVYGDAGDKNFLSEIPLEKAKMIISTIPDEFSNINIVEMLKKSKSDATFIATSEYAHNALDLYHAGVDYVLIPHHLGGEYASNLIANFGLNKKKYHDMGREHKKHLESSKKKSIF